MRQWLPCMVLVVVLLGLAGPLVWLEAGRPPVSDPSLEPIRKSLPSELKDQDDYHLPVIEVMKSQWPAVDLVHYESATAPGYHLSMAATGRAAGDGKGPLLALNLLCGVGLAIIAWRVAAAFTGPWTAGALVLPLMMSKYVFAGMVWLTTDNLGWLLVASALGICITGAWRRRAPLLLGAGALAGAAVFTRQIHVWLAAPVGFVGLVGSPLATFLPRLLRPQEEGEMPRRWSRLAWGVAAAAIPVAVLAVLVVMWGGLVPVASEAITKHAAGLNPASPAFALALAGAFGVFFVAPAWHAPTRGRAIWLGACVAMAAGALCALAVETGWARNVRDYGWMWRPLVQSTPTVAGRSLALAGFAAIGGAVLLLLWHGACRREHRFAATLLLLSMLGWLLTQSANAMAWQRYFEPAVLLTLAWLTAMAVGNDPRRTRLALAGAITLGAVQGALTLMLVIRPALAAW